MDDGISVMEFMRGIEKPKHMNRDFSSMFFKATGIIIFAFILALSYNSFSGRGISLKGTWSNKILSDSLIVPYSYQKGDPQAITLSEAMMEFQSSNTIFLDARLEFDYRQGHIKGAVNLPYEEFDEFYPKVAPKIAKDKIIVAYCDGTECESSLLLARVLREEGYQHLKVFFGGWAEWEKAGLPIEKGEDNSRKNMEKSEKHNQ
jgi:rhodanese-related sulfurtransferase